jgi:hypothetical protein
MAIKDANCSNSPETMKALVGETIVGVIQDGDGRWHLVVESGYALVLSGNGAFWTANPDDVKRVIERRRSDLGRWSDEAKRITAIAEVLSR